MVTPQELQNAYLNNVRENQIGGLSDGITPEVAAATAKYIAGRIKVLG